MSQLKNVSFRYGDEFESNGYEDELFDDPELVSLLEQILSEVFQVEEDEESIDVITGNSIYFLGSEKEILQIEKSEAHKLNEGSSSIELIDQLQREAEDYFKCPNHFISYDAENEQEYLTGFIQMYNGVTYNSKGELVPKWKSIDLKFHVEFHELLMPDNVITKIESFGIRWTELVRVMFYGPSLERLLGSRIYHEDESKELVSLSDNHPNILLAIQQLESDLNYSDSIFEFIENEVNEGIPYGITPDFGRVALGHWEWTHIRISEIEEEEMEERNLKIIEREEKIRVSEMNDFINKYKDAKDFIRGLNEKVINPIEVYSISQEMLGNILFVCEKLNFRLKESAHYYQVKAVYSKNKVTIITTQATQALLIIEKINKGVHVDFHLISLQVLEDLFAILWSGLGIQIDSSKKDQYFVLKDSLLRMRALEARKAIK